VKELVEASIGNGRGDELKGVEKKYKKNSTCAHTYRVERREMM
jgi:hypothetical protein